MATPPGDNTPYIRLQSIIKPPTCLTKLGAEPTLVQPTRPFVLRTLLPIDLLETCAIWQWRSEPPKSIRWGYTSESGPLFGCETYEMAHPIQ